MYMYSIPVHVNYKRLDIEHKIYQINTTKSLLTIACSLRTCLHEYHMYRASQRRDGRDRQ